MYLKLSLLLSGRQIFGIDKGETKELYVTMENATWGLKVLLARK